MFLNVFFCLGCKSVPENWHCCVNKALSYLQEFSLAHTRYDDKGNGSENPAMKIAALNSLNFTNWHYCCLLLSRPLPPLLKHGSAGSYPWMLYPITKWPRSAPTRRWRCFICKASSPYDRCDQTLCWNGRLPNFHSLTSYHGVYKSPYSTVLDDNIVLRALRTVERLHVENLILPLMSTGWRDHVLW